MIALALVIGSRVAHAGRGGLVPPMKIDVGLVTSTMHGEARNDGELMIGLHLATVYPRPLPFDVGIGFISIGGDDPAAAPPPSPTATPASLTRSTGPITAPRESMNGAFLEVAGLLAGGEHWRTWISGRVERFHAGDVTELGSVVRVTGEIWTGAVYADGGGAIFGVLSLGAWAEGGVRGEPDGETSRVAATGLSLRVPLIIAD